VSARRLQLHSEHTAEALNTAKDRAAAAVSEAAETVQITGNAATPTEEALDPDAVDAAQDLKEKGNALFSAGNNREALDMYSQALAKSPPADNKNRAIYFSNCAACHLKLEEWSMAALQCTKAIEANPSFIRPYQRRAQAKEAMGRFLEAASDLEKVVELDSSKASEVEKQIATLKSKGTTGAGANGSEPTQEEMLGQLKNFGTSLLGKFGMKPEDFKMDKDPTTGAMNFSYGK